MVFVMIVIDATDKVLGRLAVFAAKKAMDGEEVRVVNAEKAIITGNRDDIFNKYKQRRDRGERYNGPYFPRMPDRLVRRAIRGMIPYKTSRGRMAYKRVMVYIGNPENYEISKDVVLKQKKDLRDQKFVYVKDLSEWLGAKLR